MMKQPSLLRMAAVLFTGLLFTTPVSARPNVVIVMTDDQGYPEVSTHENPVLQTRTSTACTVKACGCGNDK